MSGSSRGQVTITLGRGQVVKRAVSGFGGGDYSLADTMPRAGTKRSVRDRLGGNADSSMSNGGARNSHKRHRGNGGKSSSNGNGFDDVHIGKDDLRFKLMQKNAFRRGRSDDGDDQRYEEDLRDKLTKAVQRPLPSLDSRSRQRLPDPHDSSFYGQAPSARSPDDLHRGPATRGADDLRRGPATRGDDDLLRGPPTRGADDLPHMDSMRNSRSPWTLDHLRQRSPDRAQVTYRGISPQRNVEDFQRRSSNRTYDDGRSAPYMNKNSRDATRPVSSPAFMPNIASTPGPAKHVAAAPPRMNQVPPPSTIVPKPSYVVDEHQTVDSLLQSLGLGKYAIIFKAEEIDMATLKQMGESDLKELGIPMGPRKKLILALLPRKRPVATSIR